MAELADLADLAAAVRAHPGVGAKAPISLVAEVFGAVDAYAGPGDDGAVVDDGDATLVVGGEALWPPFAAADPYGAGVAAVLANVNDLAAMGARPLAIVDTVVAPADAARAALAGMRDAGRLYQVPVVGGHLTVSPDSAPSISAFGLGRIDRRAGQGSADAVLSVRRAAPGQSLIVACCTEGSLRPDFNFFRSFDERGELLGGDVRVLADVARQGSCVAAKDISMAGLAGSLAMLLEFRRLGATVEIAALPRPAGVDLQAWLTTFPCFGFLLCSPPGREAACMRPFHERGLAAAVVGELDGTGLVRLSQAGEAVTVFDLGVETVTGLRT